MRLSRVLRVVLATLTAVMLLGGSASGMLIVIPTITWTPATLSANGGVDEDSAAIDSNLVAWEYGDQIRVKNLATGAVRTIPDSGGAQDAPDISGDRVVYGDNGSGNWDILMYHWSTDTVTTVRATVANEQFPRIDGNQVVWWDSTNEDLWARDYDMGGFGSALQLTVGFTSPEYDVDNGRCVLGDQSDGRMWVRSLVAPATDWGAAVHDFAGGITGLEMHGDYIAVGTNDGGEDDVWVYDIARDTATAVASSTTLDEEAPTIFHGGVAWHEAEGLNPAEIGYELFGALFVSTPSFGGAESDRYPRIYGHRIAYQRSDGADQDVMLATSDSKRQSRTAGTNRYGTAAAVSASYFADARNVVLCNGLNFPDALSAAPLAKALNGPLLLTGPNSLAPETLTEITRLSPTKVWIIGGSDVVSNGIYNQLDVTYDVERIAGDDRYATSAAIARKLEQILGTDEVFRAFFARGDAFPDALAVGPVAAAANGPVMLVRTGSVPAPIASAVNDLDITIGYVIGGTDVVSVATDNALRALIVANGGVGTITERWSGDNRYTTATAVANKGLGNRWIDLDTVGFAIGTNFPDALGGGAALGHYGSALVLTSGTSLSPGTGAFLDAHRYEVGRIDCFGGADVLNATVYNAILAKMY